MQLQIAAFLDELEKIALAGAVPKASPPPKTSSPTPAPVARAAPQPTVKPPQLGLPARPAPAIPRAPGGQAPPLTAFAGAGGPKTMAGMHAARMRSMRSGTAPASAPVGTAPPVRSIPRPDTRAVATMPRNAGMGPYVKPMTRLQALGF